MTALDAEETRLSAVLATLAAVRAADPAAMPTVAQRRMVGDVLAVPVVFVEVVLATSDRTSIAAADVAAWQAWEHRGMAERLLGL